MSRLDDIETTARIKLALMINPHVGGLEIGVETVNGIVLLSGAVQDEEKKYLASEIARMNGGIDIRNDIDVLGGSSDTDAVLDAVEGIDSPEENDALIERIIGDMESDQRINSLMINIEVANGIVQLSGMQATQEAKLRAEDIARRVPGISDVVNYIEVNKAAA